MDKVVYGWFEGDQIFYVGIGDKNRSKKNTSRNPYCRNKRDKAKKEGTFNIQILYSGLTFEQACEIECQLIQQYGRLDLGTGCLTNMTSGGEGRQGYKTKESTKKKLSRLWKGTKRSDEDCRKISEGQTGRKLSKETKLKISQANKGKKRTKEHILRNRVQSGNVQIHTPHGIYQSISDAERNTGYSRTKIYHRLKSSKYTQWHKL